MRQRSNPGRAASSQWTYVLVGALGIAALVLLGGLAQQGYRALVSKGSTLTATAIAGPTSLKPWPTVATATPTVTRPPTATPAPTRTATSTPRPTNTLMPTPTPTPTPILIDIKELGKLVTTQYKLQTISVVEEKEDNWIERLFGENKVVLVATGEVMAGVDMALITEEDVTVNGTAVKLIMPPAEIISVRLIPGESWIYDRKLNILKPNWDLELQAQEQAEAELVRWSTSHGILEQSEEVFTVRIEAFLRRLGFTEVTILFRGSEERY